MKLECVKNKSRKRYGSQTEVPIFIKGKSYELVDSDGNYVIDESGYKERLGNDLYVYFRPPQVESNKRA